MHTLQPPDLHIPSSLSTVTVSIIDTTSLITGPVHGLVEPNRQGHDTLKVPAYSFFIQHPELKRNIIFDLGVRTDLQNLTPSVTNTLRVYGYEARARKDVRNILEEHGVDASDENIEAIIISHAHYDHVGDPSRFDSGTSVVVGPGFKKAYFPGYPSDLESILLQSDFSDREVREISFDDSNIQIGQLRAVDYFGDGSFYLLDTPGHMIGHLSALARLTTDPDSFMLIGGDAVHHGGELRPNAWNPAPTNASPTGFCCAGGHIPAVFDHGPTEAIYEAADSAIHDDFREAGATARKLQAFDGADNIFVVFAHDDTLVGIADFFPATANEAFAKGWKSKAYWLFLRDFH